MKSISLLLIVFIFSSCLLCEEVHVTYSKLLTSTSFNAKDDFVTTLDKPTEKLTELVIATLNDKEAPYLQKVFALEVVAATAMRPALDASLPYIGIVQPGIANLNVKDGGLPGATALSAIGKPADDKLLLNLTGSETPQVLGGIARVLMKLNKSEEAHAKLDAIINDESRPQPVQVSAKKIKDYLVLLRQ